MENLIPFTLFGSGIAFGIMLVSLFIVLISSDINESGALGFIAILIAAGLNYFWGTFPILSIISFRNLSIYFFLGFIFSLIRTYFKGKELKNSTNKQYFNLKEHVFRWWFLFPFSLINWVFGHLLKDLYNWIYSKTSSIYLSLFNA
jgi:hypothetical protein